MPCDPHVALPLTGAQLMVGQCASCGYTAPLYRRSFESTEQWLCDPDDTTYWVCDACQI